MAKINDKNEMEKEMNKATAWMRLGGFITTDSDTMGKIKAGDKQALVSAILTNGFKVEGDAYLYDEDTCEVTGFDLDIINLVKEGESKVAQCQ